MSHTLYDIKFLEKQLALWQQRYDDAVAEQYGVDVEGVIVREDTGCFQITPLVAHITGFSPKNYRPFTERM